MQRPILDRYAETKIFSKESLQYWREKFDDDQILAFVLMEYFKFEPKYIFDKLGIFNERLIEEYHHRIQSYSEGVSDVFDSSSILIECVNKKFCSSQFIEMLKEYFSEDEIVCFVLMEYLEYSAQLVQFKLKELTVEQIENNRIKVKAFVDEEDANVDPIPQEPIRGEGGSNAVNAYYNGPRFPKIIMPWEEDEDLSPDWGYLDDIPNS